VKVLVTGASGLVGNKICEYFISKGINVVAVSHNNELNLKSELLKHFKTDLRKINLDIKNEKCNVIIHCASKTPSASGEINNITAKENREIDDTVINLAINWSSRLIYFSTAYLYDDFIKTPINESSKISDNLSPYYLEKINSEHKIVNAKINYCIFRISSPYGNLNKQKNVFKLFFDKALNNETIVLFGKGQREQNFIHISDIAKASLISIQKKISGIFLLTYKRTYSMKQLACKIKDSTNSLSNIFSNENLNEESINVNFDSALLSQKFNWTPEISLDEGIKMML
jgi:UDP-glucose 4-epimerase